MTSDLFRQSLYGAEYGVEFDREEREFRVYKIVWSVYNRDYCAKQIGSPIPKDKPYEEYSKWDYEQMIQTAIEEEVNA